jgi:predicted transcriptional regulator
MDNTKILPSWLLRSDLSDRTKDFYCLLIVKCNKKLWTVGDITKWASEYLHCRRITLVKIIQELEQLGFMKRIQRTQHGVSTVLWLLNKKPLLNGFTDSSWQPTSQQLKDLWLSYDRRQAWKNKRNALQILNNKVELVKHNSDQVKEFHFKTPKSLWMPFNYIKTNGFISVPNKLYTLRFCGTRSTSKIRNFAIYLKTLMRDNCYYFIARKQAKDLNINHRTINNWLNILVKNSVINRQYVVGERNGRVGIQGQLISFMGYSSIENQISKLRNQFNRVAVYKKMTRSKIELNYLKVNTNHEELKLIPEPVYYNINNEEYCYA